MDFSKEVPDVVVRELGEGVMQLGTKLREWREFASLDSLTARWKSADGDIEITCDSEDRVVVDIGVSQVDFTEALDRERART